MASRWWQKATVQNGLIVAATSILTAVLTSFLPNWTEAPRLRSENQRLAQELGQLRAEFAPFKVVALERFTGSESERLAKLAIELNDLQHGFDALKASQAQRTFSSDTISKVKSIVSKEPRCKVWVCATEGDREALKLAEQCGHVFAESGWDAIVGYANYPGTSQWLQTLSASPLSDKTKSAFGLLARDIGFEAVFNIGKTEDNRVVVIIPSKR